MELDVKIWLQKNDGLGHAVDEFLLGKYSKTEMLVMKEKTQAISINLSSIWKRLCFCVNS